ncbi:MAG: class I SAM-dependent RNA methyltransferase [Rectinemataceae bacterium]
MKSPEYGLAVCALGLEKVCQNEIERIGLKVSGREPGRVRFGPDSVGAVGAGPEKVAASLMRANLCLRSAERVLVEAGRFRALDFDQLFETVRALPWELYIRREDRLVIERVRIKSSRLAAQTSVQSVVHKAVYERLCSIYKIIRMSETGRERGLRVYLDTDDCLLGLDTSGEALHKRGYRLAVAQAPLKETIAAGILFLSGWSRRLPLLDPFCGSGTIAIEAALFAMDRAPGLGRAFALEDMPFALGEGRGGPLAGPLAGEVEAAKARVRRDAEFRIVGTDADPRALEAARANAARAGVAAGLEFRLGKAEDSAPDYEVGSLLCNPPYGERMGTVEESEALYRGLGEMSTRFSGWGLGFVTNRPDFGDFFGRFAPTAHKVINGTEEQWFHWYPAGSEGESGRRPEEPRVRPARPQSRDGRPGGGPRPEGSRAARAEWRPRAAWRGPDKPGWKPQKPPR